MAINMPDYHNQPEIDKYRMPIDMVKKFDAVGVKMKEIWNTQDTFTLNDENTKTAIVNFMVAELLDRALPLLDKPINIQIDEKNKQIIINRKMIDKFNGEVIEATIDDEEKARYCFIETVMDFWLRYKMTNFCLVYEDGKAKMYVENMKRKDLMRYYEEKIYNGWNPHGDFWKREWVKFSQRDKTIDGGRLE